MSTRREFIVITQPHDLKSSHIRQIVRSQAARKRRGVEDQQDNSHNAHPDCFTNGGAFVPENIPCNTASRSAREDGAEQTSLTTVTNHNNTNSYGNVQVAGTDQFRLGPVTSIETAIKSPSQFATKCELVFDSQAQTREMLLRYIRARSLSLKGYSPIPIPQVVGKNSRTDPFNSLPVPSSSVLERWIDICPSKSLLHTRLHVNFTLDLGHCAKPTFTFDSPRKDSWIKRIVSFAISCP